MALPAPGKLPRNTGLSDLGFTPAMISKLTPAAKKLNKGDLIALQKWGAARGRGPAPAHLTVQDISSLTKAYGEPTARVTALRRRAATNGGTSYCCCCSPCCTCTAAAEISPVRRL